MTNKRQPIQWILFAATALLYCLILSFRPVPKLNSANDTGRYVQASHQYCAGTKVTQAENKEASYATFYAATSLACLVQSDNFFMFEVAAFVPLIFLLFVKWRNGTYLWACSLIFSVTGIEMMTNAMRQSLAMLLFFGALALLARHRYLALLMALVSIAAHSSTLYYSPLLLWFAGARLSKKMQLIGAVVLIMLCIIFYAPINSLIEDVIELNTFYSTIYAEALSTSFILFIALPMFWVYGVRHYLVRKHVSIEEKTSFIYSMILLLISFIAFPAIIYRFALFGVALQIFLAARSEKPGVEAGAYALIGSLLHLVVMLMVSNNYAVLING